MSWSWTLYRYLAVQFLLGVAAVYAAFLVLAFSIDVVDLLNRTAGHDVSTSVVVGMAALLMAAAVQLASSTYNPFIYFQF